MRSNLYNSDLALATRIAIILAARPQIPRSEQILAAIDFLVTNAGDFGLYPTNLHGDSIYVSAEFPARLQHIQRGLRYAVTRGFVTATPATDGIHFRINPAGAAFVDKLRSQYLNDFKRALTPVLVFVDSRTDREVLRRIERQDVEPSREDRT